jgi:2-methylcitrate dehydratase PrpD
LLPDQLTPRARQFFKRNILDSLGCGIAALPGLPFQALREQFEEYRAPGRCTLIGGGKTSADQAALFNSGLARYVDLLDSYMSAQTARIQAPDAQAMVARIEVRPDADFTARYPQELCARITIHTKDQRILVKEQIG